MLNHTLDSYLFYDPNELNEDNYCQTANLQYSLPFGQWNHDNNTLVNTKVTCNPQNVSLPNLAHKWKIHLQLVRKQAESKNHADSLVLLVYPALKEDKSGKNCKPNLWWTAWADPPIHFVQEMDSTVRTVDFTNWGLSRTCVAFWVISALDRISCVTSLKKSDGRIQAQFHNKEIKANWRRTT